MCKKRICYVNEFYTVYPCYFIIYVQEFQNHLKSKTVLSREFWIKFIQPVIHLRSIP